MTRASTWASRGKSLAERFWEKVQRSEGCWLWLSAIGSRGYGIFWIGKGKSGFAHRIAYEMAKGQIPTGMLVMHSCDNPRCVNPDHLSVGTNSDNLQDASRKGRIARGEKNGGGKKLTEEQVADIKRAPEGCQRLSQRFGVSTQTIKAIRRGRIWRHVDAR